MTVGQRCDQGDAAEPASGTPGPSLRRRAMAAAGRHVARFWRGLSLGGVAAALIFFCLSMTPSLLPRPWFLQGVASGICVLLGYAAGTAIGALLRRFGFRALHGPRGRRIVVRALAISAAVLIPGFGALGAWWQHQLRLLVHADLGDPYFYPLVLLIAFAAARALLSVGRLLRWAARSLGRFGARWIPLPVAKLVAALIVAALVVTVLNSTLVPAVAAAANASFSLTDQGTAAGAHQPQAAARSGSPRSLVPWTELGREGRSFVSSGPTPEQIESSTHRPAREPIRVYAGSQSADGLQAEADLVVAELHRTGAFRRAVLVVATTTGRGWINQVAAAALEYMWNGDTAIAAMQYSYLPSPVAFVADTATPPRAGRILFDTVAQAWKKLPEGHRPRLIVMGESLGSYGSQGAFDGIADALDEADGAVWVGTPSFTPLWRQVTANRRAGSPEQVPDVDGCTVVCFTPRAADIPAGAHPRVVFLQHTNDPVVWWSWNLLLHRPDWLREPAQPGRSPAMTWLPLVTFWQLTADMVFSSSMPDGYGHHYALELVNAFAAVAPPPGWDAAQTTRLRAVLARADTGG